MLLQKIIQELRYIPDDRLVDLYRVIYKSEKPNFSRGAIRFKLLLLP
jgi:hypothetical protein